MPALARESRRASPIDPLNNEGITHKGLAFAVRESTDAAAAYTTVIRARAVLSFVYKRRGPGPFKANRPNVAAVGRRERESGFNYGPRAAADVELSQPRADFNEANFGRWPHPLSPSVCLSDVQQLALPSLPVYTGGASRVGGAYSTTFIVSSRVFSPGGRAPTRRLYSTTAIRAHKTRSFLFTASLSRSLCDATTHGFTTRGVLSLRVYLVRALPRYRFHSSFGFLRGNYRPICPRGQPCCV